MLTAITKPGEVRAALKRFYAPLRLDTYTERALGHQGKTTGQYRFYWHPDPGLWAVLETSGGGNRSWNCFGTSQTAPSPGKPLAISCEINIPHEGMNRRIAGVFARDAAGVEYVAHSGKINSSREGINKDGFLRFLGENCVQSQVQWPGTAPTPYIVISDLRDPALVKHVHAFVRSVETFKDSAIASDATVGSFTPEFDGRRAPYTLNAQIQANSRHGQIVNALEARLSALSNPRLSVINNKYTDLLLTQGPRPLVAFEVKSSANLTDIYTAIGQLMYRTADLRTPPAHVAVLPEDLPADTLTRLKRIGLHVCTYRWERGKPVFPNLPRLLPRILRD